MFGTPFFAICFMTGGNIHMISIKDEWKECIEWFTIHAGFRYWNLLIIRYAAKSTRVEDAVERLGPMGGLMLTRFSGPKNAKVRVVFSVFFVTEICQPCKWELLFGVVFCGFCQNRMEMINPCWRGMYRVLLNLAGMKWYEWIARYTPPKLTEHLKMDGWKTRFLLGWPNFRGMYGYVSFRECIYHILETPCYPPVMSLFCVLPIAPEACSNACSTTATMDSWVIPLATRRCRLSRTISFG